jgi:tetratricopeptide (TPR) repeat protein
MRLQKILLASLIAIWIGFFAMDRQVDGWKKEADRFLAAGQAETAYILYQRIAGVEPWRALDWRTLAYLYARQDNPEKTISILEPWIRNNRLAEEDAVILAHAYRNTGLPEKGKQLLENAVNNAETADGTRKIMLTLAQFHRADQEFDQAYQCFDYLKSRRMNTQETDFGLNLMAGVVSTIGESENIELDESSPDWLKDWAAALAEAKKEPDDSRRWLIIGRAYANIGEWDLAEYAFIQSTKISPELADAWGLLGEARQQQGKGGTEEIKQALKLTPDSSVIRLLAALYYRRQHDTRKAVDLLQKNINDNPDELIWYLEMGNALAEGGKLDDAVLAFQQAVDLNRQNPAGYKAAARFSILYGYQLEEVGMKAAESVIQLQKDSAEGYDLKGQVLLAMEKKEDAAAAFDEAVKKDETYAPAWLHIGQMAIDAIDYTRAQEALTKAVSLGGRTYESQLASRLLKEYFGVSPDLP